MLPDYPDIKHDLEDWLMEVLRRRIEVHSGFVAELAHHRIHEGRSSSITRADGTQDETEFVQVSEEISIRFNEMPSVGLVELLRKIDDVAARMAKARSEHFFNVIDRTVEKTGNIVSGQGKPLTADTIIDLMEKMDLPFDQSGKLDGPTIVIAPSNAAAANAAMQEIGENPDVRQRYEQLVRRKYEEWRAREAGRMLVG